MPIGVAAHLSRLMPPRRFSNATDEITRIVGKPPPVLREVLHGGTRLTGRWVNEPYDVQLQPMQEHVIAATFEGSGKAIATIDGRTCTRSCRPGTITMAPRGHDGHWRLDAHIQVSNIYLGHDRVQASADLLAEGRGYELLDRVNHPDARLFAVMSLICAEVETADPSLLYLEHAVDLLCLELLRNHSSLGRFPLEPQRGLAHWQVRRVTGYMREHLDAEISLQELANLVGMSRYHFCSAFRRATGSAPYECLTRMRMEMACDLLRRSALQVGDIAGAVGYGRASAFSSAFRKVVGVTPREYRRRL